jgi:cell division protein FtsN
MRAQLAAGNARAACSTAGSIKAGDLTADLRELIANEQKTACALPAEQKVSNTPPALTAPPAMPASASAPAAQFAVQIAAFREVSNATSIAAQLKRSGFDVRVVYVEGNSLARVRIGRFKTNAEAASELKRAQSAGLNGIIVDDVQKEKNEMH